MGRDIKLCHPKLQQLASRLIDDCNAVGLKIGIAECYRTIEEQNALYAKGRTVKGNIVTNVKGTDYGSMHQWFIAFDFYRNDGKGAYNDSDNFFSRVGKIGQNLGLEWGGSWKTPVDKPHFQLPDWGSTPKLLKSRYGTPDNFKKSWNDETMTEKEIVKVLEEIIDQKVKGKEYYTINQCPDWGKMTVQKLINKNAIAITNGTFNLPEDMLRTFVILDRMGILDK